MSFFVHFFSKFQHTAVVCPLSAVPRDQHNAMWRLSQCSGLCSVPLLPHHLICSTKQGHSILTLFHTHTVIHNPLLFLIGTSMTTSIMG